MKISESQQLKLGTVLSYLQTGVSMLISLIYTPAMLSLLGKSEYGLYSIATTTVSYVNLLNMGFSSSYVRFYSKDKAANDEKALAKTNGLFCMVFFVIGILALISGFILIGFSEIIFDKGLSAAEYVLTKKIMFILTVSTAYNLATSVFSSIIIAHERFVFHKMVNLIKVILSPSITWILLIYGYKSLMMAFVTAGLTVVADTFYVVYCFKALKIKINLHNPSKAQLKDISVFSGFIALSSVVEQINWSVDKLILGRMWGAAYTAVYSVAATINNMYVQISTAISNVFVPRINQLVAKDSKHPKLTEYFIKIGRMQMLVLLPIMLGFIFFGRNFIRLWAPSGYGEVYVIALLLMLPATVPYTQNIGITIQMAQNKHQFRSVLYAAIALVNLIVSIALCRRFGAVGCAAGTAFSIIAGNIIIMNIYYHKKIGINIILFWKSMLDFLPAAVIMSVTGYAMNHFINIDSWLKLLFFGGVFCIIYLFAVWFTAMNQSEKSLILGDFLNKRKKIGGA